MIALEASAMQPKKKSSFQLLLLYAVCCEHLGSATLGHGRLGRGVVEVDLLP